MRFGAPETQIFLAYRRRSMDEYFDNEFILVDNNER